MEIRFRLSVLMLVLICTSGALVGQTDGEPELLDTPPGILNCSDVLRYVDDAVLRAGRAKTRLFLVVRATSVKDGKLVATRSKYLKTYFRSRRINIVEVVSDMTSDRSNLLDLYLGGQLLYSLPIRKRETMYWAHC